MEKKVFKKSELPVRKTVDLLPEIFRSPSNDKFLSATLDALTQPGSLDRISGYLGRSYGKIYNGNDIYIDVEKSLRHAYQLEPAVVVNKNDKTRKFYDYIDFKSQLKFFNNRNEKDNLTSGVKTYSWNPPIDWDKFVNYREYYWLPNGPATVSIEGQSQEVISSYKVRSDGENEYIFFPDGLTRNPSLTLYRGQTYEFNVNVPGDPFFIRTSNLAGDQSNYNKGVTNNGAEVGKVVFQVPLNAPDLLYYQSGTNINRVGSFRIANITENTNIDIEAEIIGKQNYTSSNGVVFTNGLKINFVGKVSPAEYAEGEWFVEGVGESIRLVSNRNLDLPPIITPEIDVLFDDGGFDSLPFDDAVLYPNTKDYITINRSSNDKNPWSRYNKWFHRDVINYSAQLNGTAPTLDETTRAKRPIIEFKPDIALFNHGTKAKQSVDFIDDFTTDVFSTVEGTAGYNIDGGDIFEGARIIFTADKDPLVKNKIFEVKFITIQTSTNLINKKQIALVEAEDSDSTEGECLIIRSGKVNAGLMYHYTNGEWVSSQRKTAVNQSPKFDVFDASGISLGDTSVYDTSTFTGSELVSYKQGIGSVDSELGFAISYLNINNSGDIQFEFDWDIDQFTHHVGIDTVTKKINTGYIKIVGNTDVYDNLYTETDQDFVSPIIQSTIVEETTNVVNFNSVFWDEDTRNELYFYKNGNLIKTDFTVIDNIEYTRYFSFDQETFVPGDVVTLKMFTDAEPNEGFYEIPVALEKNPLNAELTSFTLGQVNDHLRSMIELSKEFVGQFPGTSNLRDISRYTQYGTRFVKHSVISSAVLPLLIDKNYNLIKSLRYSAFQYETFKNNFLNLAVDLPFDGRDTVAFFDEIISKLGKVKSDSAPFSNSDMIGSGAFKSIKYTVEDEGIKTFALSEKYDLSTPSTKAVYVYINNNQLIVDRDYTFDSTFGFVRLLVDLVENDQIEIREYYSTSFNFIPETPSSMGLYKKWVPELFVDDTFVTPTPVIRGHDGSITVAFGDFRDDLLLELEKRIFNNIKQEYDHSLLDYDSLFGGYYKTGVFTSQEVNTVLELEFLRWPVLKNIETYAHNFYDGSNEFTWSYNKALDLTKQEKLPSYWRGMYQYLYDTQSPHTSPWEMLGFSMKPDWWNEEYGPAPYTSGNLILWEDLAKGIIKQGPRAGTHSRYARPALLDMLPVDEDGNLLPPLRSGCCVDFTANFEQSFKFGDISPTEHAWRRSSYFPFALLSSACLLRPFDVVGSNINRSNIEKNILGQIVNKTTQTWQTKNDIVTGLTSSTKVVGLLSYIVNYLKSISVNSTELVDTFTDLDLRLTSRLKGFVDKSQQKFLLDSKNPNSKQTGIFIPPEDFEIFFNVSSPVVQIKYSGVIIEKVADGFKVSGYDKLDSNFKYYKYFTSLADPVIEVGGISEEFTDWSPNKFYSKGTLTRYDTKFYRATTTHTSGSEFSSSVWTELSSVPKVGSVTAVKRTQWNPIETYNLNYGTIIPTIQEVVDFLLGYGKYLESVGVVLEEYNQELATSVNWESSCREFMFWTTHNWATGSIISVSPAAQLLKISNVGAVADNLLDSFYDYTILSSSGLKFEPSDIDVYRSNNEIMIAPIENDIGIYFAIVSFIQKEHVVIFKDRTIFNDVIYDKGPGYRQERIKWNGFRTTDWDGDYTSPGFIYDAVNINPWKQFTDYKLGDIVQYKEYNYVSLSSQKGSSTFDSEKWSLLDSAPTAGLVPNFDYKINLIEDYYEQDISGVNSDQKMLAKHTVGYQPREYLESIAEDEISQFKLFQGFSREKGTINSITKVFDKVSKIPDDKIVINEEWAFRLGTVGGSSQISETEFDVESSKFKLNPQPVLLNGHVNKDQYQNYILLGDSDYQIGDTTFKFPTKYYDVGNWTAGYVYPSDVNYTVNNITDFLEPNVDINAFNHGDLIWSTFEATGWNVYRYEITNILVGAIIAPDVDTLGLITNRVHPFKVGDIVGVNYIPGISGFYEVKSVGPKLIVLAIAGFKEPPELDQSTSSFISRFVSTRIANTEEIITQGFARLPVKSKLFVDSYENDKWAVLERNKQYVSTEISEYGIAFPTGTGASVTFLEKLNQTIVGNPGAVVTGGDVVRNSAAIVYSQGTDGLIPLQILTPKSGLESSFLGSYAESITASKDGRWLIVGSPKANYIPSGYKETFDPNKTYRPGDTVLYAGKLWKAVNQVIGDGSTIDLYSQDWTPVELHTANPLGSQIFDSNPGYRNQGAVDIFEYDNGQWVLRNTIISPRPAHGEFFGKNITIGKLEGIEGTSGDLTLTVTSVTENNGIASVTVQGSSGLNDGIFENLSGIDVSTTGSGATFDVRRSIASGVYTVTVRNGGTRYVVGDRLKIEGSRVGGISPINDIIITVIATSDTGEILGSETFTNVSGINNQPKQQEALFRISKVRDQYATPALVNAGLGYQARSVVRYAGQIWGCIKDTGVDKGVWSETTTYYPGDIIKYPSVGSQWWEVLQEVTGVTPEVGVSYKLKETEFPNSSPEIWEPVAGGIFPTVAVNWSEKDSRGNLIKYTSGSTILIPGSDLGGLTPTNDLLIKVDRVDADTGEILNFSFSGTAASGVTYVGVPVSGEAVYNDIEAEDISISGSGAIFNITRSNGSYSAVVTVAGSRYAVGDQIRILGSSIGAQDESYYMSVSAPGSRDDVGRVYLYVYDGIAWKHFDEPTFVGLFDINKNYPADAIVWYQTSYWKANTAHVADGIKTPADSDWEDIVAINTGILPKASAFIDDGSTIETGSYVGDVEFLNIGDKFGTSTAMSNDGQLLIISAPYSDSASFDSYRGEWRITETYLSGDIVRYNSNYYKLTPDSTTSSIGDVPSVSQIWELQNAPSGLGTGSVFVYKKNQYAVYELIQTIDKDSVNTLAAGDEFGYKVFLTGDGSTLFIGTPNGNVGSYDQGTVYVYNYNGTQFVKVQDLTSATTDFDERFGSNISVSPDNNVLAISAEGANTYTATTFDLGTTGFDRYVTNFRDTKGKTGKVFVFNKLNSKYILSEIFEDGLNVNEDFGASLSVSNNSIIVGSPRYLSEDPAFREVRIGRIQKFTKNENVQPWTVIRNQTPQVDISKIKNLALYEKDVYRKIADVDIVDPFKEKILSIVEQNLDFKTAFDPAVYTISTNDQATADDSQAWFDDMVGTLWWNTSAVKYLVYEQGDLAFRNGNWGATAEGSNIEVYEWVRSTLRPSQWVEDSGIGGTPLYEDNSAYSTKQLLDPVTGNVSKTYYYYWVRAKEVSEITSNKTLSASQAEDYIRNPGNSGLPFVYLLDDNKLSFVNIEPTINADAFSVNIQFFNESPNINLVHNEFVLMAENTVDSPNEELERKWIDSLIGEDISGAPVPDKTLSDKNRYGLGNRPKQTMFVDRNAAVEITIDYINEVLASKPLAESIDYTNLDLVDSIPSVVKNLYDKTIDTEAELRFISTAKIKTAKLVANVVNGKINTVDIIDPGYGYKRPPKVTVLGSGSGAEIVTSIDNFGRVTSVTIVKRGNRYLSASLQVRPYSVLVKADSTVDNFWSIYAWDSRSEQFYRSATQAYDTPKYWEKIDWWESGYSEESRIKESLPGLYAEQEVLLEAGDLVRLEDYGSGGWAVLERTDLANSTILGKYKLVGRELGTIRILNKFFNTEIESTGYDKTQTYDSNKYDLSSAYEFRNILRAVKEDIFVNDLKIHWNKLFFVNIHYIMSEQLYVDWAFKTSFLTATHNVGYLEEKLSYKNDNLSAYQQYIEEVKPYRTKVRKYVSRYLNDETSLTSVSDFDVPPRYDTETNSIVPVKLGDVEIDTYPRITWFNNHKFEITDIVLTDNGKNYTTAPVVLFTGGGGSGAKAKAYVSSGKVTKVVLLDGGSGYTSAPTVELVGGVGTAIENSAKAVAIIGNSKARLFNQTIKFDRISKTPTFKSYSLNEKFIEVESGNTDSSFIGTGRKTVFDLKYPSTTDKSKISVYINDEKLLASEYSITLFSTVVNGLTVLKGKLTINTAPLSGDIVKIEYEKNDNILDSLNRIDKYYKPTSGMLGLDKEIGDAVGSEVTADYSQLVTGIDFGGVIVQGATFDVGAGWDALPWFTESWDSAVNTSDDFYVAASPGTYSYVLPYIPAVNENINIYLRRAGAIKSVRLDDPNYDGTSILENQNAIMLPFTGNGTDNVVTIPNTIAFNNGDTLVFRLEASDGTTDIQTDFLIDANVSGGSLSGLTAYSTATGTTPEEIVIDGEKFISPDQVPAPEENVPGQVIESLSIKVFHSDRFGSPSLLSRIYTATGTNTLFKIDQKILENQSVIVFVDKDRKSVGLDYTIDYDENSVRFISAPSQNSVVEIFSLGVGGTNILDYREYLGDGDTRYFITSADFVETSKVFATINGVETPVGFVNSNGIVNNFDNTLVEFGIAPPIGATINIVVFSVQEDSSNTDDLVRVNYQTFTLASGDRSVVLSGYEDIGLRKEANVIVELNNKALSSVDTTVKIYDGDRQILIGNDPQKSLGDIVPTQIKLWQNNVEKSFGDDYVYTNDGTNNYIELLKDVSIGDIIVIEDYSKSNFTITDDVLTFSEELAIADGDVLNVTWAERYTSLDALKDIYRGGQQNYKLARSAISISYVWVYKNGDRLTPDIDFYVGGRNDVVYITGTTELSDVIEIISFSNDTYSNPIAYEIFRDVLNRNVYNRYQLQNIVLAKDLAYYDTEITLVDASILPETKLDQPGIISIGGEKIQYLSKQGNVLKNIRRGLFGTSIKNVYPAGTEIVNTSYEEKVPYNDRQEKEDFVSDGTTVLIGPLSFVPTKTTIDNWYTTSIPEGYGRCDSVEVFVGGRRLRKDSASVFDNTIGSYSPAGDVQLEAEFSVDGTSEYIRLTTPVSEGTRITVVRRTGNVWYARGSDTASNGVSLGENTSAIARFLQNSSTKLPE